MTNNIFDALEICLQEIENGADLESVLLRFPELADELRPILETSVTARELSAPAPSADVVRRNRARILQRAAEMRESGVKSVLSFNLFAPLRRAASTLVIVALVFASGTSLVGASSTSLPGDNLYPVKRSWEAMQLVFTFNARLRDALEVEHENERLEELQELFASGRSAKVMFSGVVTLQSDSGWLIAGIPVIVSPETHLPGAPVTVNSAVQVEGVAQTDGSVLATSIELLPSGANLPEYEDDHNGDENANEDESQAENENEAPVIVVTSTPVSQTPEPETQFNGVLDVLDEEFWTINGINADITTAEVEGSPAVGAAVIVEGFFNEEGVFIVTKIKFIEPNTNTGGSSGSNNNGNDSGNDNNGNDNNDNDDNDDNDDDNSGSGGGGDD